MTDLYIAPEGALQFELKRVRPGDADPTVTIPMPGVPIWVLPPVAGNTACGCGKVYEVLLESLRPEHLEIVKTALAGRNAIYVCDHTGRVIE